MTESKAVAKRFETTLAYIERYSGVDSDEALKLRLARDTLADEQKNDFLEAEDRDAFYRQATGNDLDTLLKHKKKQAASGAPRALPEHVASSDVETGLATIAPAYLVPSSIIMNTSKNALPPIIGAMAPAIQDAEYEEIPDARAQTNLPALAASELDDEAYAAQKREEEERIRCAAQAIEADETLPGLDGNPVKLTDHGRSMLPLLFTVFRTDKTIPAELCNITKGIEYRNDPDRTVGGRQVRGLGDIVALKLDNNREIIVGPGFVGRHSGEAFDLGHARGSVLAAIGAGWTKNKDGSPRPLNLSGPTEKKEMMWVQAQLLGVKTDFQPAPDSAAHKLLGVMRGKQKRRKPPTPEEVRAFGAGIVGPADETAVPPQESRLADSFTNQAEPKATFAKILAAVVAGTESGTVDPLDIDLPPKADHIHSSLARIIDDRLAVIPRDEILDKTSEAAQGYWKMVHVREQLSLGKIDPKKQAEIAQNAKEPKDVIALFHEATGTSEEDTNRIAKERMVIEQERVKIAERFAQIPKGEGPATSEDRELRSTDFISKILHKAAHEEVSDTGALSLRNLRQAYVSGLAQIEIGKGYEIKKALEEGGAIAAHGHICDMMEKACRHHERYSRARTAAPEAAMA